MNDQLYDANNGGSAQIPAWIEELVGTVAECIEAHVPMGELEFLYGTDEDLTELVVYPTPVELVGGAVDGAVVTSGFSLDLGALQAAFDQVDVVYWQAHGWGPHDEEGPHISLEGTFQGHLVWLRLLSDPPEEAEPGLRVDTSATQ